MKTSLIPFEVKNNIFKYTESEIKEIDTSTLDKGTVIFVTWDDTREIKYVMFII